MSSAGRIQPQCRWLRLRMALGFTLLLMGPRLLLADPETLQLARELDACGDWTGSATEFRRLALGAGDSQSRGAFFWWSAWQTRRAGNGPEADRLAGRAESADPQLTVPVLLLRGHTAMDDRRWAEAAFYFGTVTRSRDAEAARRFAVWRLAEAQLRVGDAQAVREALATGTAGMDRGAAAWAAYEAGRDKSPRLGGWLGVLPGAGYMYSGEWANGVRSLLLNGLFLFGMAHTAEEGQWGAFAAITFFEITWYSGSIYGGVDAAHRYNRRRLEACATVFRESAQFDPDADALPGLLLRFRF